MAVAINADVDTGRACGSLTHANLHMESGVGATWVFQPPTDPSIRAMVIADLDRHTVETRSVWKLRAIGQGWADGLNGLASAHGSMSHDHESRP
ncbi:TerD family protein [Streptomyces mayonensis]|uniref:TerD family protein n=1 Tax=Streptomyces mayonensis TaxID=2750816 RepID=UPI0035ABD63F